MRSGVNMDIIAKSMLDDPASDVIYFFHDEAQNELVASIKRGEFAGVIFHSRKSGVITATTPLPQQRR
jgi:imidazoleglycerol phosphate synthase glutamine amidotransferase subunit HisH